MKTPREVLLKHHQSAEPKLERMWSRIAARPGVGLDRRVSQVFLLLWRELILPSRRIWAGLACVWVVIAALNLASSEPSPRVASNTKPPSREELRALVEQRQMLAQLIGPFSEPANTQKRTSPGPRSERAAQTSAA
jgi:hypothetical protein